MNTPAYQSMQKIQSALAYTSNVLNEQDYVKPTLANDPEYQRLKTATRFIALSAGYAVGSNRGAGNAAKGMNSGRKPTQVKPSADGDGMTVQLGGYTVRQDGSVVGPKGGASQSVGFTQKGDVVYRTQSGGYFTVSKGVRTNITAGEVTTNKPHGNTLGDQPAECYALTCKRTGEVVKYGETTRGEDTFGTGNQKRYTKEELKEMNAIYTPLETGTKKDMHLRQHQLIEEYKVNNNGERPKYNKNDY